MMRILLGPGVRLRVLGVAVVLAVVYVAYLAAVTSPEESLDDLPLALVNEDEGAELAGERVNLGDRVVENATGPDSPASDAVAWSRPGSREEALEGLRRKEYYGAIVIPSEYSARIAGIAGPPEVPIAVVN